MALAPPHAQGPTNGAAEAPPTPTAAAPRPPRRAATAGATTSRAKTTTTTTAMLTTTTCLLLSLLPVAFPARALAAAADPAFASTVTAAAAVAAVAVSSSASPSSSSSYSSSSSSCSSSSDERECLQDHSFLKGSAATLDLGFNIPPPIKTVTVEGSRLLIPCEPIRGEKGLPNVTWTNEESLVNEPRRHVLTNGTLLITEVRASDAGQYRCVLRQGTRAVLSAPAGLVLADTGSWQMLPRNSSVRPNSAVRLTCHLPSIPPAALTWLVDGETLERGRSRFYQPVPGVLQITSVKEEDAGVYKCRAVNAMIGKNLTSPGGYLSVVSEEPPTEESSPTPSDSSPPDPPPRPTLLAVPSKVEVEVGHRAVLECITDDVSRPRLDWSRIDGRPIRKKGVAREGQGSLVFQQAREQDAGVYNCSVISPLLHDPVTQMIELAVLEPPRVDVQPRRKIVRNGGSIVRLNCTATGVPLPEVTWHKDGRPIPRTGRHTVITQVSETSTLTRQQLAISNIMANDSGIFQCIVKNRVGVASEAALLKVDLPDDMPGAPLNLRVTRTSPSSIEVKWDPPPVPPGKEGKRERASQGYVLHYFQIHDRGPEKQSVTNTTSYEILKLTPYTLYSIYVRTFVIYQEQQNHLIGEPSATLVVRTMASRPSSTPDIKLDPLSPTKLRVTWAPLSLEEARGAVVKQKIQWRRWRMHFFENAELSEDDVEFEIRDLRPNKRYEVRVLVATESGYPEHESNLPWKHIRMPSDAALSTAPVVHLSVDSEAPDTIQVDWVLPDQLRTKVLWFVLTYNSTAQNKVTRDLEASSTSYVLHQLEPRTNYTVKLEPMYKIGRAGSGVSRTIRTLPIDAHPTPAHGHLRKMGVKNLKVKTLNSTCIQMSWRPAGRRVTPDFYTVKMVNLGLRREEGAGPGDLWVGERGRTDFSWIKSEQGFPSSENTVKKSQTRDGKRREETRDRNKEREATKEEGEEGGERGGREGEGEHEEEALEGEFEEGEHRRNHDNERRGGGAGREEIEGNEEDYPVRYIRVTRRSILQCDLRPCSGYEVTVTAWAEGVTSKPTPPIRTSTKEGVPSAPTNVSWTPVSPKDVALRWSPPKDINGVLLNYLVSYSHDQQEWRNHTVSHEATSTEIRGLISNTNYTLSISGVTRGGVGRQTRVYVYIRAILFTGEEA
ncbi:protogenin A, partial [Penaeus vannamei]|uniref:protogenin A n=1 Tax=Penaeus vannamei TaxID=6689 RepID=UPI00387F6235